jgi:UDP-N-acetylglucosamine--N-acetylmuramyl-(pentapeptide) pyrophosphoryl-undecaprenol N-acetylglucosamine transferase
MEEALIDLREMRGRLRIIHQTGGKDYAEVQKVYEREGFEAEVYPFIYEMDRSYAAADLVLCRAGATTLFELMAMGKPAILVPYPYAANDHQTLNALTLVDAGAAVKVADGELTGKHLGEILRQLSGDPGRLKRMGEQAAALAKPRAAEEIVEHCYEAVGHG